MLLAGLVSLSLLSSGAGKLIELDNQLIPREVDNLFGLAGTDLRELQCTKPYEYLVKRDSTKNIIENDIEFTPSTSSGRSFEDRATETETVENKLEHVVGPNNTVYYDADWGLFSAVLASYNNHWTLRTSPDDWWIVVVRRVAQAMDEHGDKEKVRNLFVNHQGQKKLGVVVGASYSGLDYGWLFDQFSAAVRSNINNPSFVDTIQADFNTTTPGIRIISQVMMMSSVKKYFAFSTHTFCGVPNVDMKGSREDWAKLVEKFYQLEDILRTIKKDLELDDWFEKTREIFEKLVDTYNGQPDLGWWGTILSWEWGGSGSRPHWEGWFPYFLGADDKYRDRQPVSVDDFPSGLVTVPLHMEDANNGQPVEDDGLLVAGTLGFTVEEDGRYPVVEPHQVWSLLLPRGSPLKQRLQERR